MVNNNKVNTLANAIKGLVQDKESTNNKTSSWNSSTNNTRYPTEKLVKDSLDGKANSTHNHTKSQITDFPTIPSASSTTPSADTTSGSYGSGTSYARSNHTHPKSSLYAEASHTHTKSQITDFPTTFENGAIYVEGTNADTETTTNTFKATLPLSSSEIVDGLKLVYKVSVTSTNNTSDLRFRLGLSNSTQENYVRVNNALTTANLYPRNTLIYFVRWNGFWHIVGLSSLENSNNKVTSWSSTPTDTNYPSEKLVKDSLDLMGEDTGWKEVTFKSGFSHYFDSNNYRVRYRRVGKVVELRGSVKNSNKLNADTDYVMATISDTTCRPDGWITYVQQGSGINRLLITINSDGEIIVNRYGTTAYSAIPSGTWINVHTTFLVD